MKQISGVIDKEIQKKVEELEKQMKQMKGYNSLGSVNLNDLCIVSGLKFTQEFKYPDFKNYDDKTCPCTHFKLLR